MSYPADLLINALFPGEPIINPPGPPEPIRHHTTPTVMHLKIPSDEAIGQQLRVVAQVIAVIAVAFYIAGHTLGYAIHWLSLNLTQLPAHAIDQLTADHASTHPPARHPNGNHRVSARGSRQPKPQSKHSKSVRVKL